MQTRKNDNIKGALLAATGFSLFAMGDAVFKYLGPHYSIYIIGFFTSLFALIALTVFAVFTGGLKKALQTKHLKFHIMRGLFLTVEFILIIYAFTHMTLAKTYALIFATPFLTTILSIPLLKEQVGWRRWLAVMIGFTGVLIILRPGVIPLDGAVFAALGAAFFFALSNIAARHIGPDDCAHVSFGLYVELIITPLIALLALTDFVIPAPPHLALLVFSGLTGAAALVLIALGFTFAPAAVAAPFHYIQMLWGIGLGYIIFGDALDLWTTIGAAVIIGSGLWLIRAEKQKEIPDLGGP